MGIEYKLRIQKLDSNHAEKILRSIPHFSNFNEKFQLLEFRSDKNRSFENMPDAYAKIENEEIYFCDNLGLISKEVLENIIKEMCEFYGKVIVEEL